ALVDGAADRSGVGGKEHPPAIRGEDRNVLDTDVFGLGVAENRPRDGDVAEIEAEIDGGLQGMVDALDDDADPALGEIVQRGLELEIVEKRHQTENEGERNQEDGEDRPGRAQPREPLADYRTLRRERQLSRRDDFVAHSALASRWLPTSGRITESRASRVGFLAA